MLLKRSPHKTLVVIFITSILLSFLVAVLRGGYVKILGLGGLPLATFVGFLVFYSFTLYLLCKYRGAISALKILLAVLIGAIIMDAPDRFWNFKSTAISFPDCLSRIIAILLAFLCFKINGKRGKILLTVTSACLFLWMSYFGYNLWFNKLNHGSWTGKIEQTVDSGITPHIIFNNSEGANVQLRDLKGKYILLDFWSSTCGVCFRKFPEVQKLYDKYITSSDVDIYSVFCTITERGETQQTGSNLLTERGYTFPVLSIDMSNHTLEEIGVTAFPTVIIFNPEGKMIFRGNIESSKKYLDTLISD